MINFKEKVSFGHDLVVVRGGVGNGVDLVVAIDDDLVSVREEKNF